MLHNFQFTLQKFIRGGLARASYRRLKHEQNTRKLKNAAIVIQVGLL